MISVLYQHHTIKTTPQLHEVRSLQWPFISSQPAQFIAAIIKNLQRDLMDVGKKIFP